MISDPHFIKEHAYRAPKHLLLYLPKLHIPYPKTVYPCHATIIDEKWSPSTWATSHMDPDDHLFASCNGLLCFYKKFTLKVVNLATGQWLHLSKPDGILLHDFNYLYSFGFHPTTGEYKLVHFQCEPQCCKSGQPFHFNTIQVYTFGDGKWRNIKAPRPCCMVNLGVVNVDGAMYWLTQDEGTNCGMAVMPFDLKEETFTTIQLPPLEVKETDSCANPRIAYYIITEIDQKPCFIHREKILLQDCKGNVWYHDLRSKNVHIEHQNEVKLLHLGPHRFYETQSYFYKETLVPLSLYAEAATVRTSPRLLAPAAASH
ncbi:hypothetical protein C2845_PM04G19230 [Panicum miliaceum]|uniref:F-box associated beta-propeller type 3 domain-containing protein n=1 Tax=Panicum miliaceum TaxID=4540 RepID=A0A3L6QV16_PANMI|nr:hypothetical protein C2845_PM04G19230 [Panicum miliaceum]